MYFKYLFGVRAHATSYHTNKISTTFSGISSNFWYIFLCLTLLHTQNNFNFWAIFHWKLFRIFRIFHWSFRGKFKYGTIYFIYYFVFTLYVILDHIGGVSVKLSPYSFSQCFILYSSNKLNDELLLLHKPVSNLLNYLFCLYYFIKTLYRTSQPQCICSV